MGVNIKWVVCCGVHICSKGRLVLGLGLTVVLKCCEMKGVEYNYTELNIIIRSILLVCILKYI